MLWVHKQTKRVACSSICRNYKKCERGTTCKHVDMTSDSPCGCGIYPVTHL